MSWGKFLTLMSVDYPFLVIAIALLWFPRQWLRLGAEFKNRPTGKSRQTDNEPWNVREAGDPRISIKAEFSKFRNYVDLLRAAVGSLAFSSVLGLTPCLRISPVTAVAVEGATPRNLAYVVLLIRLAILFVGLVVQTVRFNRGKLTLYPPIFYLAGLTVGMCDPWTALFAFVLIWAVNGMFGGAQSFLTAYAVVIATFGYFMPTQGIILVIMAAGFCFFPVLFSLAASRPLVIFSRKAAKRD